MVAMIRLWEKTNSRMGGIIINTVDAMPAPCRAMVLPVDRIWLIAEGSILSDSS